MWLPEAGEQWGEGVQRARPGVRLCGRHGDWLALLTAFMKVVKGSSKASHHQEKTLFHFFLFMSIEMMGVNYIYCGNYFAVYVSHALHLKHIQCCMSVILIKLEEKIIGKCCISIV